MSSGNDGSRFGDDKIATAIIENEDLINENRERIRDAFRAGTDPKYADQIGQIGETLHWLFRRNISDDETDELINAILNSVLTFNSEVQSLLEGEVEEDLIDFFVDLRVRYSDDLTQSVNLRNQGEHWWNDITTSIISRFGNHLLTHEFTVNMEKTVTITNRIGASHGLARHILDQTKSARNIVGDDALREADKQALEDIIEIATDLVEDIEYVEEENEETSLNSEENIGQ